MTDLMQLRSVSFDTSFLLKEDARVDQVIHALARDRMPCFITATVASELERLHAWGRTSESGYKQAMKRWAHSKATVINFKNRLLSDAFGQACMRSMESYGINPDHVINDCNILVSVLKNGIDLFLSEDFHFTSPITREVIAELKHAACTEYHLMCGTTLYSVDTRTFLESYQHGSIDLDIVRARQHIRETKEND